MMIPLDLEATIQRYETAIAAIENTIQTAVMIQAKVLRREINLALNADATKNIENIETENIDEEINTIIDTAAKELTNEQILEVLAARDAVQLVLSQETPIFTGQLLEKLKRGDRYLKSRKWLELIGQIDLGEWRDIFHPPETAWWWYLELPQPLAEPEPVSVWNRFDKLWNILTWVFLTISISIVGNVATKVFSGDAENFLGIFSVVSSTIVTFLSGKQALTQKGKEDIQTWLENWQIDKKYLQEARCIIAVGICGVILSVYYLLVPTLANCLGDYYGKNGQLDLARQQYELAIELKSVPAYPKLAGVLVNQGKSNYGYADKIIRQGLDLAQANKDQQNLEATLMVLNQLAREYNLQKNTTDTIPLLHQALKNSNVLNQEEHYNLITNLGWAYLNKESYYTAIDLLSTAETIAKKSEILQSNPDHHCLLGIAYRELNKNPDYRKIYETPEKSSWQQCLDKSKREIPEQLEWILEADKR